MFASAKHGVPISNALFCLSMMELMMERTFTILLFQRDQLICSPKSFFHYCTGSCSDGCAQRGLHHDASWRQDRKSSQRAILNCLHNPGSRQNSAWCCKHDRSPPPAIVGVKKLDLLLVAPLVALTCPIQIFLFCRVTVNSIFGFLGWLRVTIKPISYIENGWHDNDRNMATPNEEVLESRPLKNKQRHPSSLFIWHPSHISSQFVIII